LRQSQAIRGDEETIHIGSRDGGNGRGQGHRSVPVGHEALERRSVVMRQELAAEVVAYEGRLAHVLEHGQRAAHGEQGAHERGIALRRSLGGDHALPVVEERRQTEIVVRRPHPSERRHPFQREGHSGGVLAHGRSSGERQSDGVRRTGKSRVVVQPGTSARL
jgi:hypothetical protein